MLVRSETSDGLGTRTITLAGSYHGVQIRVVIAAQVGLYAWSGRFAGDRFSYPQGVECDEPTAILRALNQIRWRLNWPKLRLGARPAEQPTLPGIE